MGETTNSVTDQVAKVREQLIKAAHEGYEPDPLLLQAARLIATLAAEVEARREGNTNAIRNAKRGTGVLQAWQKRVATTKADTDALLAEVSRG